MTPKVPPGGAGNPALALLERIYAPLMKQLDLTSDQSRRFCEVILDCKMRGQAQMADILRHENINKMTSAIAEIQKETDASLQAMLGPDNFALYQEYQTSMPDRSALEMMKNDFARNPLTEEQQQHLLKAMESARKALGDPSTAGAVQFSVADTSAVMNEKLNRQQLLDQHVLQQAAGFLSPVQLQTLGAAQEKMMNARKGGYAKAREMFGTA